MKIQLFDWFSQDEKVEVDDGDRTVTKFVVYAFGKTVEKKTVSVRIENFTPFFWIELPYKMSHSESQILLFDIQSKLPFYMKDDFLIENCIIREKFRFRDYQWNQRKPFIQLRFQSIRCLRAVYKLLKKPMSVLKLSKHLFPIYEKNIDPVLRLIHLREIKPSGWIEIKKSLPMLNRTTYDHNLSTDWQNIFKCEEETIGPIKIASFDIEADSSHGDFPLAKKDYYKLAMDIVNKVKLFHDKKEKITPAHVEKWINESFKKGDEDIHKVYLKYDSEVSEEKISELSLKCYDYIEDVDKLNKILSDNLPEVKGDKVIQIGTVLRDYGSNEIKRHIVVLGSCDDIPGVEVVSTNSVPELILEWVSFIQKEKPSVITGYNIFGFDFKFLWECADEYSCRHLLEKVGPLPFHTTTLEHKELKSSALGQNHLYYFNSPGIVLIDLMKVVQRDHCLSSYKLDNVSVDFINGQITSYEVKENTFKVYTKTTFGLDIGNFIVFQKSSVIGKEVMGKKRQIVDLEKNKWIEVSETEHEFEDEILNKKAYSWAVGKDDVSPQDIFRLQNGTSKDRALVAKYCVQDCELCINLMQKLEVITNNIGMSNVCLVPFSYLFMRGQMIKTLSLISSECRLDDYLIPELPPPREDIKETYEGAEVLEPKPAIYLDDPISVLDYGSLYPSSMIGNNISHDMIIKEEEYQGDEGKQKLEALGIEFEDITYDNYINILKGKTWKKIIHPEVKTITCRYVQPPKDPQTGDTINEKRGILPRILMKLLKARKSTRNKIKTEKDPFKISVLDGLQLAYKVTANSVYGGVGAPVSPLYYKDIAASTTATGREHLHLAESFVKKVFPQSEVVYGDSVTNTTPILFKLNNIICVEKIETLFDMVDSALYEDEKQWKNVKNVLVWTEMGWTKLNQIIRHKTDKDIFRVITKTSSVDVTEDHSLIKEDGIEISPKDVNLQTKLLQSFPILFNGICQTMTEDKAKHLGFFYNESKRIGMDILNGSKKIKESFLKGLCSATKKITSEIPVQNAKIKVQGEIPCMEIYVLIKSLNYNVYVENVYNDIYTVSFNNDLLLDPETNKIKKIENIGKTEEYVYDLSTENHHFQAGIGNCIVHNTDSIFVNFHPVDDNGNKLTGKEAIQKSIDMSVKIEEEIQNQLKYPHKLEYEKTFCPFILLSKKRYIGNKYEFSVETFKQSSMGVVTKRRDNAPIVKYIYDGVIHQIINEKSIEKSLIFVKSTLDKILSGKFPINYFKITKNLKGFYVNPLQIVHKVLADRMAARDPGNKPQSNDRIPYVYIFNKKFGKNTLQGERVEHPDYILENKLQIDYLFYLTNQIMKPVCQIYALCLEYFIQNGDIRNLPDFEKLERNLIKNGNEKSEIREKLMKQKVEIAEKIIFQPFIQKTEHKRKGQTTITSFFSKS